MQQFKRHVHEHFDSYLKKIQILTLFKILLIMSIIQIYNLDSKPPVQYTKYPSLCSIPTVTFSLFSLGKCLENK